MPDDTLISCASYTHARRHPMVLGRIAGWAPPVQLTIPQVIVLLGTFAALTWTWSLWAPFLPPTLALLVGAGGPIAAAWAARYARIEGRSLPRAAVGYAILLSAPHSGHVGGRPYRAARAARTGARVWTDAEASA